jgi:hypothetical protein
MFVARLVTANTGTAAPYRRRVPHLDGDEGYVLDRGATPHPHLGFRTRRRRPPAADEVGILAAGLYFRDVVNALA